MTTTIKQDKEKAQETKSEYDKSLHQTLRQNLWAIQGSSTTRIPLQ